MGDVVMVLGTYRRIAADRVLIAGPCFDRWCGKAATGHYRFVAIAKTLGAVLASREVNCAAV